jgi:uncharacterized membrane protein (DUF2068 family)
VVIESTMPIQNQARRRTRISAYDRWLVVIGGFKLFEAALLVLLGVGVIRMLHKDLGDELTRLFLSLRFDPEGRFASFLIDRASDITPHQLKQISIAIFAHAGLDVLEGVGLILRKIWAEFVTIAVSAFFLPFEFAVLAHHVTWIRIAITGINVAVVVYLIFHVQMRLRERRHSAEETRSTPASK